MKEEKAAGCIGKAKLRRVPASLPPQTASESDPLPATATQCATFAHRLPSRTNGGALGGHRH